MAEKRGIGPRVDRSVGPRITSAQPTTPPTDVQLGQDRLLAGAREVDLTQLRPDPDQPRRSMNQERLRELAHSIAGHGLLQPLLVRQDGMARDGDMRYTIIAGGRRYAALQLAVKLAGDETERRRLSRVPVVVSDSPEAERRVLQLVENLQREDLSPVEEARVLREIQQLRGWSMEALATSIGRSQGYVDERLRLLRHEQIAEAVELGVLTRSAGAAIASIAVEAERQRWLERARRGDTIRPREVYASKQTSMEAKHGEKPAEGGTQEAVHTGTPEPESRLLVPVAGRDLPASAPLEQQPGWVAEVRALLAGQPAGTVEMVRTVLEAGARAGKSCAEVRAALEER